MRITTQMLNEAAKKAGLPVNQHSLLDYLDKSSSSAKTDLFESLSNTSSSLKKITYENIEKAAESVKQAVSVFVSESEENIFTAAQESGSNDALKQQAQELIDAYNDMVKQLTKSTDALNVYYKKCLAAAAEENKEALSAIGITVSSNGTLCLNESKFDAADLETVCQTLGSSSSFLATVEVIAEHVSDNAQANLQSISGSYNASGSISSLYRSSQYNVTG